MRASDTRDKHQHLIAALSSLKSAAVGFSGGVDSTLLLHAARLALGDAVLAITLAPPFVPHREIREAAALARHLGCRHAILRIPFPEAIRKNPPNRCYRCKQTFFSHIIARAAQEGICHILDGTHVEDLTAYRPGLKILQELNIISPLKDAGLTKAEIRQLSRDLNLPTWQKPADACLLSRIPSGVRVDSALLRRIEAAETFLMEIGFPDVRVRTHGTMARIEVPKDQIPDIVAASIVHGIDLKLKTLGYTHVAVDLAGYQTGSLDAPEDRK